MDTVQVAVLEREAQASKRWRRWREYVTECLSNWLIKNKNGEDLTDSFEVSTIELSKPIKEYKNNLFYD